MKRTKKPAANHPWRQRGGTTKQIAAERLRQAAIIPLHAKPVK